MKVSNQRRDVASFQREIQTATSLRKENASNVQPDTILTNMGIVPQLLTNVESLTQKTESALDAMKDIKWNTANVLLMEIEILSVPNGKTKSVSDVRKEHTKESMDVLSLTVFVESSTSKIMPVSDAIRDTNSTMKETVLKKVQEKSIQIATDSKTTSVWNAQKGPIWKTESASKSVLIVKSQLMEYVWTAMMDIN